MTRLFKDADNKNFVIWLDLENIRGKTGFAVNHEQVLESTRQWARYYQLTGHVVVAMDHGSITQGYVVPSKDDNEEDDLVILFAGNHYPKADDLLADWVGKVERHSVIVTADTELQSRCRKAASQSYYILDPIHFLEDLESLPSLVTWHETDSPANTSLSLQEQMQLGTLDEEIRLRAQILDTQVQIQDKKGKVITNKRRKKLQAKLNRLQTQLARRGPSLLDQIQKNSPETTMILQRYKELQQRRPSGRKEQTGDRVVLAEQLRRQLEQEKESAHSSDGALSPAKKLLLSFQERFSETPESASVQRVQSAPTIKTRQSEEDAHSNKPRPTKDRLSDASKNPIWNKEQIDIVAISDTHGFERQLLHPTPEGTQLTDKLPMGDVLLHLGDFTTEGSTEMEQHGWKALDEWLAQQPHPIKIIVRGNHDPFYLQMSKSCAWFITEPTTVALTSSLQLGIIPYGSSRKMTASRSLPTQCDILATHVPPLKTLDRTFTGKSAGSGFLNKAVASMKVPPSLWLCGHIHEGRGVSQRAFHKNNGPTTTVINVANANGGRATHLDHGAVMVRVSGCDGSGTSPQTQVEVLQMVDQALANKSMPGSESFFKSPDTLDEDSLVLAVDLGLKSGVSMFDSRGRLLRYEQFNFEKDTLQSKASQLFTDWPQAAAVEYFDGNTKVGVSHIAIEGADGYMLRAWADAAPHASILRVSPEEWRAELLIDRERTSGSNAKAASRLIARQLVEDIGVMARHQGKFPTDVAESLCLGLYVCHKLGWIKRKGNSIVQRYTNGNVVVPK